MHGWDDARSQEIVGQATASTVDQVAIGASSTLATTTYQKGAETFGGTMVLAPGVVLDQAEADLRAKSIADDLQAATLRISGECMPDAAHHPGRVDRRRRVRHEAVGQLLRHRGRARVRRPPVPRHPLPPERPPRDRAVAVTVAPAIQRGSAGSGSSSAWSPT